MSIILMDWEYAPSTWVRIASAPYCTKPSDTPANTEYMPKLRSVPFTLAACDVLHRESRSAPLTQALLQNLDRRLDFLLSIPLRNTLIEFRIVEDGAAYSTATLIAKCWADRFTLLDKGILTLKLRTAMDRIKWITGGNFTASPVAGLNNSRAPVVFGDVDFVEGVIYDETEKILAINDRHWWGPTSAYKRGEFATFGTDYTRAINASDDLHGLDFGSFGTGKVAVGVKGSLKIGDDLLLNGDFTTETAGVLANWTTVSSPPNSSAVASSGGVRIFSDGPDCYISQSILTSGQSYYFWIACSDVITGSVEVFNGATLLHIIDTPGWHRFAFTATASSFKLQRSNTAPDTDVILDYARCYEAEQTNRIGALARHLIVDRMGFEGVTIDDTSLDALETACPYDLGALVDGGRNIEDVLREALDSMAADVWSDLTAAFRFGRLRDPTGLTPVVEFAKSNIRGGIRARQDDAPQLSVRLSYAVNYAVHANSDFASGVDATTRAALSSKFSTVLTENPVSDHYSADAERTARLTWLRDTPDAQTQINAETALFSGDAPAQFFEFEAILPAATILELQPFDPVRITYDINGLDTGQRALLFAISSDLCKLNTCNILAWGIGTDD